jgi:chromatin segregation and condensation protein Rec8/ScpA/Scc1 (kleisin family)
MFLAVLELVRHCHVRLEQNDLFGEIWLLPRSDMAGPLDLSNVDNYDHASGRTAD